MRHHIGRKAQARPVLALDDRAFAADGLDGIEQSHPDAGADHSERAVFRRGILLEHLIARDQRNDSHDDERGNELFPLLLAPEQAEALSGVDPYLAAC